MTKIYVVKMKDLNNSNQEIKIVSIHATKKGAEARAIIDKQDDIYYNRVYTVHEDYLLR